MKKFIALTVALLVSVGMAFGQTNDSKVTQNGANNLVNIDQVYDGDGATNTVSTDQDGNANTIGYNSGTGIFQNGSGNTFTVTQNGDVNRIQGGNPFKQNGEDNVASVEQFGDKNWVYDVDQIGKNNEAYIDQGTSPEKDDRASRNFVNASRQDGIGNLIDVTQQTNDNRVGTKSTTVGVRQDGDGNEFIAMQKSGAGNVIGDVPEEAAVLQDGNSNVANVLQSGSGNTVEHILQNGSRNTSLIDQYGRNNVALTTQVGTSNTAKITQQ